MGILFIINDGGNMKIIISPAKVQNGSYRFDKTYDAILFHHKTNSLDKSLKTYSKAGISKLMKIKNKLLDTVYDTIQSEHDEQHAINLYNGIVYKEINTNLYDSLQLEYMNEHLRILSAKYGILEPYTGIKPYRLDMTMKPKKTNLYHYWHDEINMYFDDELIINLASIEFSKLIKKPMINIHFKEWINEEYKIVTVRAKKARGLMVDYLITHMVSDIEGIKDFKENGYQYNTELSDENNLVFTLGE